jgi:cobalamin biosynthesis Mg chelatase CobN
MKLSLLVAIPALFAPIAAQSKGGCLAQFQVDVCTKGADAQIKSCGSDPACICQKNKDKAQCYIVCPNDELNQGQAKLQDSQIGVLCNVPGATPTSVSKSSDQPTSTSANASSSSNASNASSSSNASNASKPSGSSGASNSASASKSGSSTSSASSQFGSFSLVAISMGILASFL